MCRPPLRLPLNISTILFPLLLLFPLNNTGIALTSTQTARTMPLWIQGRIHHYLLNGCAIGFGWAKDVISRGIFGCKAIYAKYFAAFGTCKPWQFPIIANTMSIRGVFALMTLLHIAWFWSFLCDDYGWWWWRRRWWRLFGRSCYIVGSRRWWSWHGYSSMRSSGRILRVFSSSGLFTSFIFLPFLVACKTSGVTTLTTLQIMLTSLPR